MRKLLILFTGLAALPAAASSLFDENSIVEITLRGPLSSVIADKRNREERPFTLSLGGETFNVRVRIRGNSRVQACAFPPLRLNFKKGELKGTTLEGEDKLKLVTHCRNGSERSQDSLLNEYAAYRAFEAMSSFSYRVRLLKVYYEDTDGKQSKLDDPQFGFLIESHEGLAGRLGGQVAKLEAILFSELHADVLPQYQPVTDRREARPCSLRFRPCCDNPRELSDAQPDECFYPTQVQRVLPPVRRKPATGH